MMSEQMWTKVSALTDLNVIQENITYFVVVGDPFNSKQFKHLLNTAIFLHFEGKYAEEKKEICYFEEDCVKFTLAMTSSWLL